MPEIVENWGFGLAPPKPETQAARKAASTAVLDMLEHHRELSSHAADLETLSTVKGLFNRVYRQDQWDWFTVRAQLGHPSGSLCSKIADSIGNLRAAIRDDDSAEMLRWRSELRRMPARKCLMVYLGKMTIADEAGAGWVYVLSTREIKDLLKIGMTTQTVPERARNKQSDRRCYSIRRARLLARF
jgi:hypothetical protein